VLVDALKNLAIIGALFMIMGYGRVTRPAEAAYGDV
jgi:putative oxidoreductase